MLYIPTRAAKDTQQNFLPRGLILLMLGKRATWSSFSSLFVYFRCTQGAPEEEEGEKEPNNRVRVQKPHPHSVRCHKIGKQKAKVEIQRKPGTWLGS